ncbi:MAG: hypothetical protein OEU32_14510 [Acidimicrobiia bacterium]|nr:hypothetical protein [Acidimicrobiia bacterium]
MRTRRQQSWQWAVSTGVVVLLGVSVLLVVGEVYAGSSGRPELAETIDGEPAPAQLVTESSAADVRNVSVVLGLLALAVLVLSFLYWRHTGRAARRRFIAADADAARPEEAAVASGHG